MGLDVDVLGWIKATEGQYTDSLSMASVQGMEGTQIISSLLSNSSTGNVDTTPLAGEQEVAGRLPVPFQALNHKKH